jgi:putative ATPase
MSDTERGLGRFKIRVDDDAMAFWATTCDGDARRALTALEIAVLSLAAVRDGGADASGEVVDATRMQMSALNEGGADLSKELHITLEVAQESMQRKAIVYDATGDEHYDAASALIKSIRGSDVNAAVYWLARMLEAGEDPRFISRRLAILASEDIGQADPTSLLVAAAAQTVTERIGMPECQLTLAQAAIHLALAPKSNSTTIAIGEALKDVREGRTVPVPVYLKDAHYAGAEKLGHGVGYVSPHKALAKGETPPIADYLGVDRTYYRPIASGREARFVKDAGEEKE